MPGRPAPGRAGGADVWATKRLPGGDAGGCGDCERRGDSGRRDDGRRAGGGSGTSATSVTGEESLRRRAGAVALGAIALAFLVGADGGL